MSQESSTARKIDQARTLLANSVGIVLTGYRSILIGFKSELSKRRVVQAGTERRTIISLVLSGSSGNLIDFERMMYGFSSRMVESFSIKDLSSDMYRDVISAYIKNRLYDKDNENPIAFETLIVQVEFRQNNEIRFRVTIIDHFGDYSYMDPETSHVAVIGCPHKKQKLLEKLQNNKEVRKMTLDKLKSLIEEETKEFSGELDYVELSFDPEDEPAN